MLLEKLQGDLNALRESIQQLQEEAAAAAAAEVQRLKEKAQRQEEEAAEEDMPIKTPPKQLVPVTAQTALENRKKRMLSEKRQKRMLQRRRQSVTKIAAEKNTKKTRKSKQKMIPTKSSKYVQLEKQCKQLQRKHVKLQTRYQLLHTIDCLQQFGVTSFDVDRVVSAYAKESFVAVEKWLALMRSTAVDCTLFRSVYHHTESITCGVPPRTKKIAPKKITPKK